MRIAIDARWIFPEISGIGAYTRELIRALARLNTGHEYVLLFCDDSVRRRTLSETGCESAPGVSSRLLPYGVFSPRSQWLLPRWLRGAGIEVFHSTNYMIPYLAFPRHRPHHVACVTTVHDVIPMILRDLVAKSVKARLFPLYRRIMIETGIRSDAIITDSAASRADVIAHLRIPAEATSKVQAIPCGVAPMFRPPGAGQARGSRQATDVRTVLYVGRADPYKDLPTLVRAFAAARQACPFPLALTVAGSPDPRYPEAPRLAVELGVSAAVTWTGYLPDSDLVAAYQNADVLVHPSLYEGFGLQVAEAMACGLPVICSDAASLPEVVGGAAILVKPRDVDGFAHAIVRVLSDPSLAADLTAKGVRQAAQFTWQRTAAETVRVYEQVGAQ